MLASIGFPVVFRYSSNTESDRETGCQRHPHHTGCNRDFGRGDAVARTRSPQERQGWHLGRWWEGRHKRQNDPCRAVERLKTWGRQLLLKVRVPCHVGIWRSG